MKRKGYNPLTWWRFAPANLGQPLLPPAIPHDWEDGKAADILRNDRSEVEDFDQLSLDIWNVLVNGETLVMTCRCTSCTQYRSRAQS